MDDDDLEDDDLDDDIDDEDFEFMLDMASYQKGAIPRALMLRRWRDRFVDEEERVGKVPPATGQSETETCVPNNEVPSRCEPRGQVTARDVAPIGTPSLLNWAKRRGMIAVPADFVRITRNAEQAVLLAQLCFWFSFGKEGKQRANFRRFGRIWEPKTHVQWSKETGISVSRVKAAIQGLCDLGFIERKYARVRGARTTLLRPLPPAIAKACGFQGKKSGQCESD